jgi:hypothetical protein
MNSVHLQTTTNFFFRLLSFRYKRRQQVDLVNLVSDNLACCISGNLFVFNSVRLQTSIKQQQRLHPAASSSNDFYYSCSFANNKLVKTSQDKSRQVKTSQDKSRQQLFICKQQVNLVNLVNLVNFRFLLSLLTYASFLPSFLQFHA